MWGLGGFCWLDSVHFLLQLRADGVEGSECWISGLWFKFKLQALKLSGIEIPGF